MHINLPWNCSLCGRDFSLFPVQMLAKPYHLGVNGPTTHCKNKDGVHFFPLNFQCHNRHNQLLLCSSENSDIAWCYKTIQSGVFLFSSKKRTKSCFILKNPKNFKKNKTKKTGGLFFWKKTGFSQPCPLGRRDPVKNHWSRLHTVAPPPGCLRV